MSINKNGFLVVGLLFLVSSSIFFVSCNNSKISSTTLNLNVLEPSDNITSFVKHSFNNIEPSSSDKQIKPTQSKNNFKTQLFVDQSGTSFQAPTLEDSNLKYYSSIQAYAWKLNAYFPEGRISSWSDQLTPLEQCLTNFFPTSISLDIPENSDSDTTQLRSWFVSPDLSSAKNGSYRLTITDDGGNSYSYNVNIAGGQPAICPSPTPTPVITPTPCNGNKCSTPSPSSSPTSEPSVNPSPSSEPSPDPSSSSEDKPTGQFNLDGETLFQDSDSSQDASLLSSDSQAAIHTDTLSLTDMPVIPEKDADFNTTAAPSNSIPDGDIASHGKLSKTIAASHKSVYRTTAYVHASRKQSGGTAYIQIFNPLGFQMQQYKMPFVSGTPVTGNFDWKLGYNGDVVPGLINGNYNAFLTLYNPYGRGFTVDQTSFKVVGGRTIYFRAINSDGSLRDTPTVFVASSLGMGNIPVSYNECTSTSGNCVVRGLPITKTVFVSALSSPYKLATRDFNLKDWFGKDAVDLVITAEYGEKNQVRFTSKVIKKQ